MAADIDSTAPGQGSPLTYPIFRSVWLATLASSFGSMIQSVGASWMMLSLTHSADMVALVQASVALPIMLLALVAGAIADNRDRRKVMLAAQTFQFVMSIALTLFAWVGLLTPWLLLCFTFMIGCGAAMYLPAWQASVDDMVPRGVLPRAVAFNSMAFNIARSLGSAIGGAIVAGAGAAAAFAVNALSYIGVIGVLTRWQPQRPPRLLPPERLGVAMAAGVRYVAMSPGIMAVFVRVLSFGLVASSLMALMPLVARDVVVGGPLTYGFLLGAFGVGAVGGALSASRLHARFTTETVVRLGILASGVALAAASFATLLPITMIVLCLSGMAWVVVLSTFNITVQMSAPRWVVGRALAIYQMGMFAGVAAGSWIWGMVAEDDGVRVALLAAGAAHLLSVAIGLWRPLPPMQEINLSPSGKWEVPETAVRIEPRSGPIVVTIEYRIRSQDIAEFLTVMSERRRVRIRDGARHWTLLRDLSETDLWTERYHTSTWTDYIRHNQRRTVADVETTTRIMALHQGPEPPRVHRMIERQTGSLPGSREGGIRDLFRPHIDTIG